MVTNISGQFDAGVAAFQSEEFGYAEIISGDTPPYVSDGPEVVDENTDIAPFSVVGRVGNEVGGALVMANYVGAEGDGGAGEASLAGTFSGVGTAADTITLDGRVYTLRAVADALDEVLIGASAAATALNFANTVNADAAAMVAGTVFSGQTAHATLYATVAGAVVTIWAIDAGTAGNAIIVAEAGTGFSFAGAATTLAGGTDAGGGGIIPIGVTLTPLLTGAGVTTTTDIIRQGCLNPKALVWHASFSTDARKKSAFEGSPTPTNIVLRAPTHQAVFP